MGGEVTYTKIEICHSGIAMFASVNPSGLNFYIITAPNNISGGIKE